MTQAPRTKKGSTPAAHIASSHAIASGVEIYVLGAAFLVGAITLVVEILGTRIMSPYYGASIYVWSSLIGVTLGALTVGYFIGGAAADRWPPLSTFALEIIGGALYLLLIPAMRQVVLSSTTPLGLKADRWRAPCCCSVRPS